MRVKTSAFLTHALFIISFIFYEISMLYAYTGMISGFWDYAGHYAVNIALFYVNAHFIYPLAIRAEQRRYVMLISLVLAEIMVFLCLKYGVGWLIEHSGSYVSNPYQNLKNFLAANIWRAVYILGLSTAYWFALNVISKNKKIAAAEVLKLQYDIEKQNIERNLVNAENAYLQAQLSPHLLFNCLNFVHNAVRKTSKEAAEAILILSEMTDYSLQRPKHGKVKLSAEIEHIHKLISLNQIRFGNSLHISFHVNGDAGQLEIVPLLLSPLIENIFKHGKLDDFSNPAVAELNISDGLIELTTNNKKSAGNALSRSTGLANLKKRLEIHYPGLASLNFHDTGSNYSVNLKVKL